MAIGKSNSIRIAPRTPNIAIVAIFLTLKLFFKIKKPLFHPDCTVATRITQVLLQLAGYTADQGISPCPDVSTKIITDSI